jgi:regulator of sirC expression with transglutaminase-like and TPR domain
MEQYRMTLSEVWEEFERVAGLPDQDIDLARAALLIAAVEYPNLDLEHQLGILDSLAAAASRRLGQRREPLSCVNALSGYLFDEVGFRGNQEDYYDPRNSYLNQVMERRLGIPITLSLVYIEVGKQLDVPLVAIGMPGHLLLRHQEETDLFIDPFYGGILLAEEECAQRLREIAGANIPWNSSYLTPISNREFIARMLRNLKSIYLQQQDYQRVLPIIDRLVVLQPRAEHERRDRGMVRYQLGYYQAALEDLQQYLDSGTSSEDARRVARLVGQIRQMLSN